MKTIALRFAENFAPCGGTILAHQNIIDRNGFVWYGKLGNAISDKVAQEILSLKDPRILLIHSGTQKRYWLHIEEITRCIPDDCEYPEYYKENAQKMKTWFKVTSITQADKDVMSKCTVASSGTQLTFASMHSMSPYFIIDYQE